MAWTKEQRQEATERLKKMLRKGQTVYTVLRGVSRSGMTRWIDLYVITKNEPLRLTYLVAEALGWSYDTKREALKVEGCGMDMGFHTVNSLSYAIHGMRKVNCRCGNRVYPCKHRPGYTLQQRWMG